MDLLQRLRAASERVYVDPYSQTGLSWKVDGPRTKAGSPAFISKDKGGYYTGTINKVRWKAHRLVFALEHGYLPEFIDHIDGDPSNNKVDNLRECTRTTNNQNHVRVDVRQRRKTGGWQARIQANGKRLSLGTFATKELAEAAYYAAKVKLHPTAPGRCYV